MHRRGFVTAATAGVLGSLVGMPAEASVARAVSLEALVQRSRHVVVGEALEAYSVWERVGSRKRIVTYTRVRAEELLAGEDPRASELLVRTLGGQIGELGELVHGEARLPLGRRSVLFTMSSRDALLVTAMAQGHYPLRRGVVGAEQLLRSPQATELLGDAGAAVKRLPGLDLTQARALLSRVKAP